MQHNYSYQSALTASDRIGWKVEDLIGGDKKLDFTKRFMPKSLAQVKQLSFLTPQEQLILNQIRGHEYLAMFGLVEEFILPYVVDHARPQLSGDDYRVRALLQFADEVIANTGAEQINQAFEDYAEIGGFIDNGLKQQAELEVESFVRATGRNLSKSQWQGLAAAVLKGMRWTYLGTGMTHPNFLATVEAIKPEARKQIEEMAPAFC